MKPFSIAIICISGGLFLLYGATIFWQDREKDYKYWHRHRCMTEFYEIKDAIARMHDEKQGNEFSNKIIDLYRKYRKVEDILDLCGQLSALIENKEMDLKDGRREFFKGVMITADFESGTETGHD